MRIVVLIAAGALVFGALSACSGAEPDNITGDGTGAPGPTVVPPTSTVAPPKAPKKRKAHPAHPAATPTPQATVHIPSTEFDPKHYDPEGDSPPTDDPAATPLPPDGAPPDPTSSPVPSPVPSPAPTP
jgi:hypothetical protein